MLLKLQFHSSHSQSSSCSDYAVEDGQVQEMSEVMCSRQILQVDQEDAAAGAPPQVPLLPQERQQLHAMATQKSLPKNGKLTHHPLLAPCC
jgi:hypothetical protein